MNKKDYLDFICNIQINEKRKKEMEKLYKHDINNALARIISAADSVDFFDEERRALSYKEIVNASELLGIDALSKQIVPVIDAYDCTYIVYIFDEEKWAKYSSVDKEVFKERDSLEDVL